MIEMYSVNLKKIRETLEISAAKLAKRLDVSTGSIVQYENGTRTPNYNFILRLNTILNVNLNWYVTGKGDMFNAAQNEPNNDELAQKVRQILREEGVIK